MWILLSKSIRMSTQYVEVWSLLISTHIPKEIYLQIISKLAQNNFKLLHGYLSLSLAIFRFVYFCFKRAIFGFKVMILGLKIVLFSSHLILITLDYGFTSKLFLCSPLYPIKTQSSLLNKVIFLLNKMS